MTKSIADQMKSYLDLLSLNPSVNPNGTMTANDPFMAPTLTANIAPPSTTAQRISSKGQASRKKKQRKTPNLAGRPAYSDASSSDNEAATN